VRAKKKIKHMKVMNKYSLSLFFLILFFASCDRNRNTTGWDYFPDMFYSSAYETYTPNPNFEDGLTMRVPVEGTIALGAVPFDYGIDIEERIRAGNELVNPYMPDEEVLEKGKQLFTTFCVNCHGESGAGDGHLYTSGLYLVKPRSLINENALDLKDGEIFHSITLGFGSMGAHGSQIRYNDRWLIVTYIREVLQVENK
jgi:mono/diheme cytochrome c family protein